MKIKPTRPKKLPLRSLDWKKFVDLLGKAHRVVAQYDEIIKSVHNPKALFSLLAAKEAMASLEVQIDSATLEDFLAGQSFPLTKQILNYRKALTCMGQCPSSQPISCEFLCKLHGIIKKNPGINQNGNGHIRNQQNWIGPEGRGIKQAYFFPPSVQQFPKCLDNLKKYVGYHEKDPLVQMAIFFAQLLIIHPFMDGNGRLARVLIPFFLFKKKLLSTSMFYMSHYFKKHRLEYFERLFAITKENDWEGWIRFFLKGVIKDGGQLIQEAKAIRSLYQQFLDEIGDSADQRKNLEILFTTPIMKKEKWDKLKQSCQSLELLKKEEWVVPYKKKTMVAVARLLTIV